MGGNTQMLIVFLLAFGAPALSWIVTKLKEQHEIKQERTRIRNAEEEALRTGKTAERRAEAEPATEAGRSQRQLQDLAERRKAQLEALRARQQQAEAAGAAPASAYDVSEDEQAREREAAARRAERARAFLQGNAPPAPTTRAPGTQPPVRRGPSGQPIRLPSGTVVRAPQQARPAPQQPGRRSPAQAGPQQRQGQQRQAAQRPARTPQRQQPQRPQPRRERPVAGPADVPSIAGSEGRIASLGASAGGKSVGRQVREMFVDANGRPRGRHELIKVIAATEVLGKPMCQRGDDWAIDR